jgi:hypothetical protein
MPILSASHQIGVSISIGTNCNVNGRAMAAAAVSFAGGDSLVLPLAGTVPTTTSRPTSAPTVQTIQPTGAPTSSSAPNNLPIAPLTVAPTNSPTESPTGAPTVSYVVVSGDIATGIAANPPSHYSGLGYTCSAVTYTQPLTATQKGIISFQLDVALGTDPHSVCPILTNILLVDYPSLLDAPCLGQCIACNINTKKRDALIVHQVDLVVDYHSGVIGLAPSLIAVLFLLAAMM